MTCFGDNMTRSLHTPWSTYTSSVIEKPADWFRRDGEQLRIFQTSHCTHLFRIFMNAVSVWCCPQQIEFLEAMRLQDRSYDELAPTPPFSESGSGSLFFPVLVRKSQEDLGHRKLPKSDPNTGLSAETSSLFFNQLPLPPFFFVLKVLDLWNFGTWKL